MNMNILLNFSNCIKESNNAKELLKAYSEIIKLRKEQKYHDFFELIDMSSYYYFLAPNRALKIIENCEKNEDYKIITKETCDSVLANRDIKAFSDASLKFHEWIFKEIVSMFSLDLCKNDYKEQNVYNNVVEFFGYIGLFNEIKKLNKEKDEVNKYSAVRDNLIPKETMIFPISGLSLDEIHKANISDDLVESVEKFNLIFLLMNRIIYDNIYDLITIISKSDIEIKKVKMKNNIKYFEFESQSIDLMLKKFPVIILNNDILFSYSISHNILKDKFKNTLRCYTFDFSELDSLAKMSIIKTLDLFED